uniref:non-specific serine/threonine protein kinase n=1 Tax=Cannabis sativa TaxID=3483 RepID=A0A803Q411_CANSA
MSSMPNSRQNFFFFFLTLLLHSPFTTSIAVTNNEASLLFSWLQSSSSFSSFFNWNIHDQTPCNWTAITCSSQGLVTEININSVPLHLPLLSNLSSFKSLQRLVISDANITGMLPEDIGDCTELKVIDFSSNSLVGSIPRSLGKLRYLEDLILDSNQLTGKIPVEIGDCFGLKNLLLFDNRLSGTIPTQLGKLTGLEVIRVGGNEDIIGKIPDELGNCGNLTVLGLADTKISGTLPVSLGRLKKLQTLSIYTTMISGEIPPEIGNCSELNNLVGAIPEEIGNCISLTNIDLSLNSISGTIPLSLGKLSELVEFMISNNNISGSIPLNLFNATKLEQLQLDTNQISGLIPPEIGKLSKLNVYFAWQNQLEGSIPSSLASCTSLQALDLSHNFLTGTIPPGLFQLRNLTKFLLIDNDISGSIPPDIGNCSSLVRLRLGNNRISGGIPATIGGLKSLNFLDLSANRLSGLVPDEIGSCTELQMIDLSSNTLEGPLPHTLSSLSGLQVLDCSSNRFSGQIPASFGRLVSLNKLILSKNSFSGTIPLSLGLCLSLQLLDLSSNELTGSIPIELGRIEALEIALNLSWNGLSGPIPSQISALTKLSILDLSHNKLEGDLNPLGGLDNLVSLNVSHNNFTGYLPDNKLFRQLSPSDLEGNKGLCSSISIRESCFLTDVGKAGMAKTENEVQRSRRLKLALALLITLTIAMVVMGVIAMIRARKTLRDGDDDSELGDSWPWQFTPFQKLHFSVDEILKCLVDTNVIGKGCSGVVYKADMQNGDVIAVKKLWPAAAATTRGFVDEKSGVRDSFSAEVKTLGSIRHKNIVRFLGCCWNRNTRLLMYDYMPNGSLGSILHERTGSNGLEWELRYQILLGAAQGLAYLHHDCVPPIVHRDIKANNILIGLEFEPYIADFGLAKLVDDGDFARSSNTVAGSYGYIAPGNYGVVVLEVLTGKQPIDPTIPDGLHVVDWVRQKRGGIEVLDESLLSRSESEIEEMMQALGIALLCVNSTPDERPTMKDVSAMLKEIKHEREEYAKATETDVDGTVVPKYGGWLKDDDPVPNGFQAYKMRQVRVNMAEELDTETRPLAQGGEALAEGERQPEVVEARVRYASHTEVVMLYDCGTGKTAYRIHRRIGIGGRFIRSSGVEVMNEVACDGPHFEPSLKVVNAELGRSINGSHVIENDGIGPNITATGLSHIEHLQTSSLGPSSLLGSTQSITEADTGSERLDGDIDLKKRKCGDQGSSSSHLGEKSEYGGERLEGKGKEVIQEFQAASVGGSFVLGSGVRSPIPSGTNQRRRVSIKNKARAFGKGKEVGDVGDSRGNEEVWKRCGLWDAIQRARVSDVLTGFQQLHKVSSTSSFEFMVVVSWHLWSVRNKYIHGGCLPKPADMLEWCGKYIQEFQHGSGGRPVREQREEQRWEPSGVGRFSVNVDAGFSTGRGYRGSGSRWCGGGSLCFGCCAARLKWVKPNRADSQRLGGFRSISEPGPFSVVELSLLLLVCINQRETCLLELGFSIGPNADLGHC